MVRVKMELTLRLNRDEDAVIIKGPLHVRGEGEVYAEELIAIADALGKVCENLLPTLEKIPGNGVREFAEALNKPFMEWAEKR